MNNDKLSWYMSFDTMYYFVNVVVIMMDITILNKNVKLIRIYGVTNNSDLLNEIMKDRIRVYS